MKPKATRKFNKLPPRLMSAMVFRLMPRRSRRYDYGYIIDEYRNIVSYAEMTGKNARKANIWLAGVVVSEVWRILPDFFRQFLIAMTIAAILSA